MIIDKCAVINTTMNGHWIYHRAINTDEWYGFVYLITSLLNGKQYIGKKSFHSHIRKKVAGRKNRKRIVKESNWRTYTGSSKQLNEDIKVNGHGAFTFAIISLHSTKASWSYAEVKAIIENDAVRDDRYYNKMCPAVKFIPPQPSDKEIEYNAKR